jgi:cation-transporting P-type ATPase 13A2
VVKGAPEAARSLCKASSLPSNFDTTLLHYSRRGYRVLALAGKLMPARSDGTFPARESVESNLQFLGLIVLINQIKPTTRSTVESLHAACLQQVMITGDNLATAVSIAEQAGLLKLPGDSIAELSRAGSGHPPGGPPRLSV